MKCADVLTVQFVSIAEAAKYCLNDSSCGGVYVSNCKDPWTVLEVFLCTTNTIHWANELGNPVCIYQKVKAET